jgi:TolA-binding protein
MQRTAVQTSSFVKRSLRHLSGLVLLGGLALSHTAAQAQLFSDDEARKAIIALRTELRAKLVELETQQLQNEQALRRQMEASANGQLELVRQIEQLRAELAELRGAVERASQTGSQAKSQQKDLFLSLESQIKGLDARLAALEPQPMKIDESELFVPAAEKAEFEAAQSLLRGSDLAGATRAFDTFRKQHPSSRLMPWVLHAIGNTRYALSQHPAAIDALDDLVAQHASYPRLADAMLTLAASQAESKKIKEARETLTDLRKRFPKTEQATLAAKRLKALPTGKK